MTDNACEIWEKVLPVLEKIIPKASFTTWIKPLQPFSFENGKLVLHTPLAFTIHTIKMSYKDIFNTALTEAAGFPAVFEIIYSKELEIQYEKENKKKVKLIEKDLEKKRLNEGKYDGLKQMNSESGLNLKYTFQNFVTGSYNKLAYGAALAVAEGKSKGKYNPLFIYGGSGLGKTHLMQAIGHYIIFNGHGKKVRYVTTEEFLNDLIASLKMGMDKSDFSESKTRNKKMAEFRDKYRNIDVLLIDDIQFAAGKERTQQEIFNIFDTLHTAGKQIVLTSDRPPSEIPNLSDRLKTRFEWGLTVDIGIPDLETRMAILKKLSEDDGLPLSMDVIEFVAKIYNKNIRELEGAFNKISANCSVFGITPDKETVKKIIKVDENSNVITVGNILDEVASFYNIPVSEILGTSRTQQIAHARKVAVYVARELTDETWESLGNQIGGRKHTTMMVAYDGIKDGMKIDKNLAEEVNTLIKKLNR